MNRRWLCSDVWMDILPSFERVELGLKIALLSDRFDILVDKHFDRKSELTIWKTIKISKDEGPEPKVSVWTDGKCVDFPLPDRPLPIKIRFEDLWIEYIDYFVIEFVRSNKHIWDRMGTDLKFYIGDDQPIWDILAREMLPIFATSIRHLSLIAKDLDNLRRSTSPTILTDCNQLNSIFSCDLFPDAIGDDGPNATFSAGQALSKWLHTPSKNGQPKRWFCEDSDEEGNIDWVNSLKEAFARATNSSVRYIIDFAVSKPSIEPFELVNERTKEKLTLEKVPRYDNYLLLKRYPISEKAAAIQWENDENWEINLNSIRFNSYIGYNESIGPLSPPAEEEKEKADE